MLFPVSYIRDAAFFKADLPVADPPTIPIFKLDKSATEPVNEVLNVKVWLLIEVLGLSETYSAPSLLTPLPAAQHQLLLV